jgi:hypothetical protein
MDGAALPVAGGAIGAFPGREGEQRARSIEPLPPRIGRGYSRFGIGYRKPDPAHAATRFPTRFRGTTAQLAGHFAGSMTEPAHDDLIAADAIGDGASTLPFEPSGAAALEVSRFTIRDMLQRRHGWSGRRPV